MRSYTPAAVVIVVSLAAGCASSADRNDATAAEIERQVVAAHPDFPMKRYARFYARESDGSITAVYLFANEGYRPIVGKAGEAIWTTPEKLPVVNDGGCSVVTVKYYPIHNKLAGVECNSDA